MKCLLVPVVAAGLIFSLPVAVRSAEEMQSEKTLATTPELVLQMGHFGGVWSVAFSPDGKQVLTGGTDDTAILWDAATATVLRRFEGHKGYFKTVSFSPDGKSILTGSNDDTAILWNAATGAKLRDFRGGDGSVALSPDGRLVLMGSSEKTATLWNAATGKMVRSFEGDPVARRRRLEAAENQSPFVWWRTAPRQSVVEAVAFSPDGGRVLTGEAAEQAILWDAPGANYVRGLLSRRKNDPDRFLGQHGHSVGCRHGGQAPHGRRACERNQFLDWPRGTRAVSGLSLCHLRGLFP
jgi:WD40 repeat protein